MSVLGVVRSLGGVARACELRERGIGPALLRLASERGEVFRVRKGWYADPALPIDALRAIRVGGALTCLSAARAHGLWTPDEEALHVAVPSTAARLRDPDRKRIPLRERDGGQPVVVHWTDTDARGIVPVEEAIAAAAACRGTETGFVLLESALHLGRCRTPVSLRRFPTAARSICRRAGAASESGIESLVKLVLLRLGAPFRQQVRIPAVGRVDFLVGRRLIVEADGRGFHPDPYRDRKRDASASMRGFRTLRFDYRQVVDERAEVEQAIHAALARGDHL